MSRRLLALMKRIYVIAGALVIVVLGGTAICGYMTELRAERFTKEVWKLNVGSDQTAEILKIADQFHSNVTGKSAVCNSESCSLEFGFENPLLKLLRDEKRSRLDVGLRIEDHKIGYVYIAFGIGGGATPSSVVNVIEFADSVPGGFRLDVLPRTSHGVPRIFVRFDKRASEAEKQSIFDLNLSCLNRPFKCRDAYDLAPSLPQRPEARSLLPAE